VVQSAFDVRDHGAVDDLPVAALLADYPEPMRDVAEALRGVVRRAMPEVIERVRPGWRVVGYDVRIGRRTAYFAWIMPQREHVHLGFVHGDALDDPAQLLGSEPGVRARWATVCPGDPIDEPGLAALLYQAASVAGMSRSERMWRSIARESTTGGY
jgi:hypothetical protein